MPTPLLRRARSAVVPTAVTIAVLVGGCSIGSSQTPADRDRLMEAASTCEGEESVFITTDVSGTGRGDYLRTLRMEAVQAEAERLALCGGHLRVTAFSASTTATKELYDGPVRAGGHTTGAKVRKVEEAVDPIMDEIEEHWSTAVAELPEDGSDIIGQFTAAHEYFAQHPDMRHRALLLTDGAQTEGPFVPSSTTTEATAADAAATMPAPSLEHAVVTVAGIGRVSDEAPATGFVAVLDRFYTDFCAKTNATCQVVTDLSIH